MSHQRRLYSQGFSRDPLSTSCFHCFSDRADRVDLRNENNTKCVFEVSFEISSKPMSLRSSTNAFISDTLEVTSAISNLPPAFNTLLTSLKHETQFLLIKLKEHTQTSTICPLPSVPSLSSPPGNGIRRHISASTTKGSLETRSYERTL